MENLNPEQKKAVEYGDGPLLILAGAGSGKTRVVTHRIAFLLDQGVPAAQILAVTFTNKAAEEMKTRIRMVKNVHVLACTFHSLGARMLRESIHHLGYQNAFSIYDDDDTDKLLKSCFEQMGISGDKKLLKEARLYISNAKNALLDPENSSRDLLNNIYAAYQEKLKSCNAVDFDDLLFLPVKLLQSSAEVKEAYQNRWRYLLIDEYQDTNLAQYTLATLLSEKHGNLFAVGDPDQSIYSWRGARYQNILNFESDFPGANVVTLDQNYRSTNTILKAANALIQNNDRRFKKNLWSELGDGAKILLYKGVNEKQEAAFVSSRIAKYIRMEGVTPDSIAVFYRTNAQSRPFEEFFLSQKIPYRIVGGISFYDRKEVKDLLAFLRLIISNSDLISFLRTIHIPKRGIGAATLEKMGALAQEKQVPILILCEKIVEGQFPEMKLSARAKEGLKNYLASLHRLRNRSHHLSISELMKEILSEVGYLAFLQEDPETAEERKENIDELLGKAAEWEQEHAELSLAHFLEELALRVPPPEQKDFACVQMMSLHNSKGLEFPIVFFVGLEEDLLPHINAKDDGAMIEEERRLCYVGMTRAKRQLYLTHAVYRYMWGMEKLMRPSRFLKEIPSQFTSPIS